MRRFILLAVLVAAGNCVIAQSSNAMRLQSIKPKKEASRLCCTGNPSGFAEIVSDDFPVTSRPERAMLGLNFAQAGSVRNGSESGACSWEDGHTNRAKPC